MQLHTGFMRHIWSKWAKLDGDVEEIGVEGDVEEIGVERDVEKTGVDGECGR